tara:strand:+ start:25198 stop:26391 length:1194 start_codon:yes stop_codon:yes gene_type:complete
MVIHHRQQILSEQMRRGLIGRRFRRDGFTLIELLVVISIIALIAALILTGLNRATKTAKRTASQRSAAALVQAVDQFRNDFGFLPPLVHDGMGVSAGDDEYRPTPLDPLESKIDGPVFERNGAQGDFQSIVIWNEGLDFDFFRRRRGVGLDAIQLSTSGEWHNDGAWEDRRYSKYSLAYYLTGVLDRNVDGIRGPGFARPIVDGSFLGVGYPVGSSRDRFDPMMDVDRRGVRIGVDYIDPNEFSEHDIGLDPDSAPDRDAIYAQYEQYQLSALTALVDSFGNAFRYYRWEPGRYVSGQLVVESTLDLNLPPVLIDPVVLAEAMNDPATAQDFDLTGGNIKLRDARYAVVSAGPDGLFGTENIKTIANYFGTEEPADLTEIAELRQSVWADNAVEIGK